MVAMNDLQDLFIDQLRDLYSAETQLVKALPKMVKAANSAELKEAFEEHFQETQQHVNRLEQIFDTLGEKPKGKTCYGMKGLIEEGKEAINEDGDPAVLDAGLIAAAQRVEHYEIAGYGTVRTYARLLGNSQSEKLLQQTLEEEGGADKKLTALAQSINSQANQAMATSR